MTGQKSSSSRSGLRGLKPRTPSGALGALLGAVSMSAIAGVLLTAALTPVVAVGGAAATSAISVFENLPNHIDPGQLAQPSKLYAKNNDGKKQLIAQFYAQNRQMVGWDNISQFAKDAAVAEEDPRFYSHSGVDVLAAGRAAVGNALGLNFSGASTITMQYVRNVLVQESEMIPNEKERDAAYENAMRQDIDRKLKEMKLAVSVEKKYTKDEILLGYLNIANYGGQVYGIEAAAKRYFDTTAKDLSLAQAASLVATVNQPSALNLSSEENYDANQQRRDLILNSMLEEKKITQDQFDEAIETPIEPKLTSTQSGCQSATDASLGHFCNYVTLQIMNDPSFGETQEERWYNFQRGGYQIMTTIDLDMQKEAHESLTSEVPELIDGLDIGSTVVSTEVGTGRVLAMAQNRPFSDSPEFLKDHPGYTSINYATDYEYGGSTGFQIGSTVKPFTLAEWIRSGHSVREMVQTSARTVQLDSFRAKCMGGVYGYGPWTFNNDASGTNGFQTVTTATSLSVNGGFVSMAEQLDLCDIFDLAQNMGVHRAAVQTTNPDLSNYETRDLTLVPSNVFGGIDEIAPITMSTAYAGFAGKGKVCTPIPIDSITGPEGEEVPFTKAQCHQGISEEIAAGVSYVLQDGVARGWASHAASNYGVPHIAKTGTTDDRVDHWTVGASTKVSTAMWTGNVTGKEPLDNYGMYRKANVVWPAVMNVADEKFGGDAFPDPSPDALKQKLQTVPDVSGKSVEEAQDILENAGFTVSDGGEENSSVDKGKVTRTDPAAGESIPENSTVTLYRSSGEEDTKKIPGGLVGQTAEAAAKKLNDAGFSNVYMECRTDGDPDSKKRVEQVTPKSGASTKPAERVTLTLGC